MTVTLCAKRRTKSMSCSMTSTVVPSCAICRDELAGVQALLLGHAGDRLVEQQQPRALDEHHRDLEPLLLAVRQRAGGVVARAR